MEEIEIPTEHLHETIHEKVEEELHGGHGHEKGWSMYVAISTALIAVFAAITGLMAGHYSNEALINQIKASDQWAYYQAKGIKGEIKTLEVANGKADQSAVEKYKKEQEVIKKEAENILENLAGKNFIFNLGHGILPNVPVDHARAFVDTVKEESSSL